MIVYFQNYEVLFLIHWMTIFTAIKIGFDYDVLCKTLLKWRHTSDRWIGYSWPKVASILWPQWSLGLHSKVCNQQITNCLKCKLMKCDELGLVHLFYHLVSLHTIRKEKKLLVTRFISGEIDKISLTTALNVILLHITLEEHMGSANVYNLYYCCVIFTSTALTDQ